MKMLDAVVDRSFGDRPEARRSLIVPGCPV